MFHFINFNRKENRRTDTTFFDEIITAFRDAVRLMKKSITLCALLKYARWLKSMGETSGTV
jgi:hypothetical protein